MKAALWTRYGEAEVLEIQDVDIPTPKDNQITVQDVRIIVASSMTTYGDC